LKSISLKVSTPTGSGTTCPWTKAAAIIIHSACSMKETVSVPRAFGPTSRVWAKKAQPQRKKDIEIKDLSQPKGFDNGCPEAPRARKIVFPRAYSQQRI